MDGEPSGAAPGRSRLTRRLREIGTHGDDPAARLAAGQALEVAATRDMICRGRHTGITAGRPQA